MSDAGKTPERIIKCGIKSGGCPFSVNRSRTHFLAHTAQWRKGPICINIRTKEYWELGQYGLWNISWFGDYLSSNQHRDLTIYKDHTFEEILYHSDDLLVASAAINETLEVTPLDDRGFRNFIPSGYGAYFGYVIASRKLGGTRLCVNHIDTAFKIAHVGLFSSENHYWSFVTYGKSGFAQKYAKGSVLVFPNGKTKPLQAGEFVMPSDYSMDGHNIGLDLK